jgi:hypothetical protein
MEITPKSKRRAQVKLLKQAEANAGRDKISVTEAALRLIESEQNSELIQKALAKIEDTKSHKQPAKQGLPDY